MGTTAHDQRTDHGLPAKLSGRLDPTRPLPSGWLLIPDGLRPLMPPLLRSAAALGCAMVFAMGLRNDSSALQWIYAAIMLAALTYAGFPLHRSWLALRDRRALREGRWWQGLLLGPGDLLLWDGTSARRFKRDQVEELQVESERKGPGKPERRRSVLRHTDGLDEGDQTELQMVDPDHDAPWSAQVTLTDWIDGKPWRGPARRNLGDWLINMAVAHALLLLLTLLGIAGAAAIAELTSVATASIIGILLGFPLFLAFPVLLQRLAGGLLRRDHAGKTVGWGYAMLLGFAAMLVLIGGADRGARLIWQLGAEVAPPLSLEQAVQSRHQSHYVPWSEDFRPLPSVRGFHRHGRYLGDGVTVSTSYYVMAARNAGGCLWFGLHNDDDYATEASWRQLSGRSADWLVPASGLLQGGFTKALATARAAHGDQVADCPASVVLLASPSRATAIAASMNSLLLINLLAHLLPLLVLGLWAAWQADRRWPVYAGAYSTTAK